MKQLVLHISIIVSLFVIFSCDNKDELTSKDHEIEFSLQFEVESFDKNSTKTSYHQAIQHLRILAFDAVSKVLIKQVVIPKGANPPTLLRLPWNKYTLVFLGNFKDIQPEENVTTLNSLLVSMDVNNAYPGGGIYKTPGTPYFYYKVENVQFGIISNIPVTLRPISSQIILNYINKPAYYNSFVADLKNVGLSLSMQGQSLSPSVMVRKERKNLTTFLPLLSDTLYSFASINIPYLKLATTDNLNKTDTIGLNLNYPIQSGNSYIIDYIFPNSPDIKTISLNGLSTVETEKGKVKILIRKNK